MNWIGTYTLFYREVWRFLRVIIQTLVTPMLTAVLYLMVFGYLFEDRIQLYGSVSYSQFLVPGLMMMTVIQNAFANSSSSIMQSKLMGNLVFVLMAPLSSFEMYLAIVGAALVRGVLVAFSIYVAGWLFTDVTIVNLPILLLVAFFSSITMGALGLIAGLWADKIEQLASFSNFFIMPLSFLSGVFYSLAQLPEFWQRVSHFNPFFYTIDAFRYAFLGYSDVSPLLSVMATIISAIVTSLISIRLLQKGYKIRP